MSYTIRTKLSGIIRKNIFRFSILLLALFFESGSVFAQHSIDKKERTTRVLIVFDVSRSMTGKLQDGTKMEMAKKLCVQLVDSLSKVSRVELALRMYGSQTIYPPGDCKDTKLVIPFSKNNSSEIKKKVLASEPTGITPIAYSLNECVNDFPATTSAYLNMIILITDGIEECSGDPCQASANLQKKGILLKPFIVGIGLSGEQANTFNCVGSYFDLNNDNAFTNVLNILISQTLNPTTVQINLLDVSREPTETNVNMTFYDKASGSIKYNLIHTLNSKGNPDTLEINTLNSYRIVVHTIPQVSKDTIQFIMGKHNIVGIDAPQGSLKLEYPNMTTYKNLQCIVRQNGNPTTLNVQGFNQSEKYIVGKYDLEILTLPRIYVNDVSISQSTVKTITVETAGTISINTKESGYGSIYADNGANLEWVCNLNYNKTSQSMNLQPGNYRVVFRERTKKESLYTVDKKFTVISNEITRIDM